MASHNQEKDPIFGLFLTIFWDFLQGFFILRCRILDIQGMGFGIWGLGFNYLTGVEIWIGRQKMLLGLREITGSWGRFSL